LDENAGGSGVGEQMVCGRDAVVYIVEGYDQPVVMRYWLWSGGARKVVSMDFIVMEIYSQPVRVRWWRWTAGANNDLSVEDSVVDMFWIVRRNWRMQAWYALAICSSRAQRYDGIGYQT
jgi:hypothetical protein